jgi:hypothetical protein
MHMILQHMITKLIIILTNVDLRDGSTLLILPVENGNTFVHINVNQTYDPPPQRNKHIRNNFICFIKISANLQNKTKHRLDGF